jgi:uncharacterized protein
LPKGKGPFPAVLIIGGSGQFPSDHSFYGHQALPVLADYLTKLGYATLRFDDRGAGKSTKGQKAQLTGIDLMEDAAAGVTFLQLHPQINKKKIGTMGLSAGAGQALTLANDKSRELYFAIMLSGAIDGYPHLIVSQQSKLMAIAEKRSKEGQRADSSFVARSIYFTLNEPEYEKRLEAMKKIAEEELQTISSVTERESMSKGFYTRAKILSSKQFYDAAQKPREDLLLTIGCPILIINGDKDITVDAGYHSPRMASSLEKNYHPKSAIYVLPGINHMLQAGKTGLFEESKDIEETINQKVLSTIGDWLLKLER